MINSDCSQREYVGTHTLNRMEIDEMKKLECLGILLVVIGVFFSVSASEVCADVSPGDVIDKTNWEKVSELVPAPVLEWIKKGDFILNIGSLNYDITEYYTPDALKSFQANKGKYALNENDRIIETGTGKSPTYIEGIPFPNVEPDDPKLPQKLLINKHYTTYTFGIFVYPHQVRWIGRSGLEREVSNVYINAPMDGYPPHKSLPNPEGVERYLLVKVFKPYDVAGFGLLLWRYRDDRQDMNLSYVPAIRRTRRMTPANRSDAFLGSDFCVDDGWGFDAKVSQFTWKVLRKQEALCPYPAPNPERIVQNSRGEWQTTLDATPQVYGYEKEGWKGAPWAPVSWIWVKHPVYVVEAVSKDPYYNYGKQEMWIDPAVNFPVFKVIYDRSGKYWKAMMNGVVGCESADKKMRYMICAIMLMIDDRMDHATETVHYYRKNIYTHFAVQNMNDFTMAGFQKYCK